MKIVEGEKIRRLRYTLKGESIGGSTKIEGDCLIESTSGRYQFEDEGEVYGRN